ncbi:hypothetical protein [Streptomyces scabiei]|uniref:hypothetical protein n=1 Tax=Streptomyces scabiei TaxID=1930 RepID=UPI0019027E88|nr:hypothetical protein [Streptomyces scabiei]
MLSYLAAALPDGTSPATRLIALQCALRINTNMQVSVPRGLLRSLRLGTNQSPWQELEQARWLRLIPDRRTGEVAAVLLDAALLGQAPAPTAAMRPTGRCAPVIPAEPGCSVHSRK